jgi:hypothetical protein
VKLVINDSVYALRTYRTMQELAKIGKARRKAEQRKADPVRPLDREERVRHYANQTGWTADFTPKQRRRLEKKTRRAVQAPPVADEHARAAR